VPAAIEQQAADLNPPWQLNERDTLGFEVRNDVEYGGMHWITVGPADQPDTSIVLYPPAATLGITDDGRRTVAEMMAKRTSRPPTSTAPSSACRRSTRMSFRSRPSSRTGSATPPCAIPPAI
jgi:hypothetical protein